MKVTLRRAARRIRALEHLHHADADERSEQAKHDGHDGERYSISNISRESRRSGCDCDRGDHGAYVRFEDVRAHSGHVAHVIADIVGDGSRVAGIVLRNAGFDLTDEVRSDISRLGVDAAADAGEEGDRTRTHRKA